MKQPDKLITHFGYILTAVNKPSGAAEEEMMCHRAIEWHTNLLRSVSYEYASSLKINLQYIARGRQPLQFRLIITISGRQKTEAEQLASGIRKDLAPLYTSLPVDDHQPYLFREMTVEELAQDFSTVNEKVTCTLFFRKPVKLAQVSDLGFGHTNKNPKEKTAKPGQGLFPIDPCWFGDEEFFKAMYLRQDDAVVDVELKPHSLTDEEIKLVRRVIKNPSLLAHSMPEADIEKYVHSLKRIISGKEDKFLVSVILKTSGNSPEQYLKSAIHRYFFGGKARIGHQAVDMNIFNNRAAGKPGQDQLSFIYTYADVCQAFRLPMPSQDVVPGLNIQSFSFQQIPDLLPGDGLLLGYKQTSGGKRPIRLNELSLSRHLYIMGQTGTGKSTMLKTMIKDCLSQGQGFTVIDPHGDLFDDVWQFLDEETKKKVQVIDPTNPAVSLGINPLNYDEENPQSKSLIINELVRTIASFYDMKVVAGPMFELYFKNGMLLIMNEGVKRRFGNLTLKDFSRMFFDQDFRKALLKESTDASVQRFFETAVSMSGEWSFTNFATYITSKLNRFLEDYFLEPLLTQNKKVVDFRRLIDDSGILLVRMDKGKLGADNTSILGQIVLSNIFLAGMSRSDISRDKRKPYHIFIDEFQNFVRGDVGSALSEMRKYKLSLILANQTLGQLDRFLVESLLGNAGNMVFFRPGINDYGVIAHYLEPEFTRQDILKLPNFNCIGRLLINNIPSDPFVFQTEQQ